MANTALITGADRGLGNSLCLKLLQRGWDVVAGQYMSSVSLLEQYRKGYSNSLHIVPLDVGSTESARAAAEEIAREVKKGSMKRLCFVSSEAGSISRSDRESWFGYCMSKAALNMGVRLLHNNLRSAGYTFRMRVTPGPGKTHARIYRLLSHVNRPSLPCIL